MEYPVYRKYSNAKSYFKVENEREFIQLQLIGKRVMKQVVHAKQYPEMLLVQSLIHMDEPHIVLSSKEEFDSIDSRQ